MLKSFIFTVLALVATAKSALEAPVAPTKIDGSSYGNIDELKARKIMLDFTVDFDKQSFIGDVYHYFDVVKETDRIVLDSVGIDVFKAQLQTNATTDEWKDLAWLLRSDLNKNLGDALIIDLGRNYSAGEGFKIRVNYATNNGSLAINWLKPSQTAGKKLPYLFTQCESINCRSVAPMQDSPAQKIKYHARVTVDEQFVVKMSANDTGVEYLPETKQKVYTFQNDIPMASYLIAIAVGDLEYRSLGRRVGVVTEPSQIDAVAWELSDLETLLDSVEDYLTPYIWGNYTILVLPPSFPFGGMENPLLTFASPTIITGDKSQVYVATHEIAHSWTGNDVTCQNWESFWLNEGFTVFEERKVSGRLHGVDFAKVEALLGNATMYGDMLTYGMNHPFSSLHPTLEGTNPDDTFSNVPYDKGYQLLTYLESHIGEEQFQAFLRHYILKYSEDSIIFDDLRQSWEDYIEDNYNGTFTNNLLSSIDWDKWIYQPGLPPVIQDYSTVQSNQSSDLADGYIALNGSGSPDNYTAFDDYYSNLKVIFLERLNIRQSDLNIPILTKIDADYNLTLTVDPECKQRWFPVAIRAHYDDAIEPAHEFISSQGRLKYLTPIYSAMKDAGHLDQARDWFQENIDFYHPLAVAQLQKLLYDTKEQFIQ